MVLAVAALAAAGCDEKRGATGLKRNEAVLATGPTGAAPSDAAAATGTHALGPARPRILCAGPPPGRTLPTGRLQQAAAPGAAPLPDRIHVGGAWTWISLWAAWCKPCIDEIPRLLAWQAKLGGALHVRFLSLDDDERQLRRLLADQPPTGMRASHWLPEGHGRDTWLTALGLKTEPTLPVQVLVDPKGEVRCIVQGAVEERDFARVAEIVKGK